MLIIIVTAFHFVAFYQEVWFPVFAGGIAGGSLLAVVVICALICIISYCCRKKDKHNRSFSSECTTSGSVHSFTYPNRKSTVLLVKCNQCYVMIRNCLRLNLSVDMGVKLTCNAYKKINHFKF